MAGSETYKFGIDSYGRKLTQQLRLAHYQVAMGREC